MKISFCIPTYNRSKYLAISLNKIVSQIEELHAENDVEVNLSDNASTDDTKEFWDKVVSSHPKIHFSYKRNEENLGPDRNFLSAMNMAQGEYSLLWGDDDYLKEGGLKRIYELIEYGEKNNVQIMVSSTSVIDANEKPLFEKNFLRKDIKEMLVDFSDIHQARSYFFLLKDMGGLLSFISDVIYKTSIIKELPYHEEFIGTHYAFLNYWWGWLAKGNKLYYSNISFIEETVQYQAAYGFGINRFMVDYRGYEVVSRLFNDETMRKEFLYAFQLLHSYKKIRRLCIREKEAFIRIVDPLVRLYGLDDSELIELYDDTSLKSLLRELTLKLIPSKLYIKLVNLKKCFGL